MSANTIRNALGHLQEDPDRAEAWSKLREALGASDDGESLTLPEELRGEREAAEIAALLEAARKAHASRRELDAVGRLLSLESLLAAGSPREADLVAELARVLDEELLDDARTVKAYERLLQLRPGDPKAEEVL